MSITLKVYQTSQVDLVQMLGGLRLVLFIQKEVMVGHFQSMEVVVQLSMLLVLHPHIKTAQKFNLIMQRLCSASDTNIGCKTQQNCLRERQY